jgi:FKBP-type peptidyl-prolyl cis-trans isomerase
MMMQRTIRLSALLVFVLVALVSLGVTRPLAQTPTPPPAPSDVAAVPEDAEKSPSGLAWKVLKPGAGKVHPGVTDKVKVNYNGWTTNGRIFDSTEVRGKPSVFTVAAVLPGMAEGIQLMTVGEKRRFWMPENLAYKSAPGKPQGMCVFEIELLDIQAGPPATIGITAPPDVAAPPADAQKTNSGLASKVLKAGTGRVHPTANNTVTVHYSGWTTDGKLFDSSVVRGEAATFELNGVIPGWTEGLQLMVEGEQRRFWIPANLAYGDRGGQSGLPKGMLVFDVELIKIQ